MLLSAETRTHAEVEVEVFNEGHSETGNDGYNRQVQQGREGLLQEDGAVGHGTRGESMGGEETLHVGTTSKQPRRREQIGAFHEPKVY